MQGDYLAFDPTGQLLKDYNAFCQTDDKIQEPRADLEDAIHFNEIKDPTTGNSVLQTTLVARNLEYCLNKRDMAPLASAIPHCYSLSHINLTGCGLSEFSLKLLVEAVYTSPSVTSVAIDFNPNGLYKDPTVSKKDKNDVFVRPATFRGNHLRPQELDQVMDKKGGGKQEPKKGKGAAADEAPVERPPIALPTGWHGLLLTGVQNLSLRGNGITDKQVEAMLPLLEQNTDLLSLSLWGNAITSAGAIAIANSLKTNRRLTSLNLGHNKLDDTALAAFAGIFYSMDVTVEEAAKARAKALKLSAPEVVPYPTYSELFVVPPVVEEKKDAKKKEVKPKKGEGPVERHKTEFDRDCVKLDEQRVRIPGNTALWALGFANNSKITAEGVSKLVQMLQSREPAFDSGLPFDGNVPAPYVCGSSLERIEVQHSDLPPDCVNELGKAMEDHVAYRTQLLAKFSAAL